MRKILIGLTLIYLGVSCTNDNIDSKTTLQVRLTDAPAAYDEVLIDVAELHYKFSNDTEEADWESIDFMNAGVYNLLDFTNGLDTLLAELELPVGRVSQMRLILGDNNQIKKDGVYYDLKTPSAQSSGLKFQINADLEEGIVYKLWIDFDAGRSIVETGNGKYILKPVIRTYTEATSGAITGIVSPANSKPYILSISENTDSIGTFADTITGKFLFPGMDAGVYEIHIKPVTGFMSQTIEDVTTMAGEVTIMDTIFIESL